jgi:uncharacterized protein (DUF433 family)
LAIRRPVTSERIVRDPRVLNNEPIIRGTRLAVRHIVLAAQDYDGPEGVLDAYPQLTSEDVEEAFRFYETHRAEIDQYIADNLADD